MSTSRPTVEEAVTYLARVCDGAQANDGAGFNAFDSPFGHALAEVVDAGRALSGKQQRAAYRLVRKYRGQLAAAGIDFDEIADPVVEDAKRAAEPSPGFAQRAQSSGLSASCVSGRIAVKSPFKLKDLLKSIPGRRWDPKGKTWTYPESPIQAMTIRDALAEHGLAYDEKFGELLAEAEGQRAAQVHRDSDDLPDVPVCNLPAWNHQRQAFWFAKAQDAAMLAMDMGTGKSRVTVDLLQNYEPPTAEEVAQVRTHASRIAASGARRVLIVCPPKVLNVWPREFRKHAAQGKGWHVENGTYQIERGKNKGKHSVLGVADRLRKFEETLYDCRCGKPHAVVVNYEATGHEPMKSWKPEGLDYFVMDEIHKIKAPNGVWSRWCARVGKLASRRLGLTGTPMPQSPLDVYGQYRALEPAIFGTSYTAFQRQYAVMGGYGGYEVLGLQREAQLHEKFHSIAYMVGAEVLDLPDVLPDLTLACTLGKEGAKVYDAVSGEMYAAFDAGEITAASVLVKMLRLQQITGGAVNTDSGETVQIDDQKAKLLADTLEEIGRQDKTDPTSDFEPTVVFCRFIHDLDVVAAICEETGRRYGEVSGRRDDGLARDATMNPDVDVVAVQIQSGGTGVDFTRAAYGIYYSLGFSLGDYLQSRKRLDRPGQERSVRFIHLVAQDTIDEEVYAALEAREKVVDYVLKEAGVDPHTRDGAGGDAMVGAAMNDAMAMFLGGGQ